MIFSKITCIPISNLMELQSDIIVWKIGPAKELRLELVVNLKVTLYLSFLFNFIEKTGLYNPDLSFIV